MAGNFSGVNPIENGITHPNATGRCLEWYAERDIGANLTFEAVKTICVKSGWGPFDFTGRLVLFVVLTVVGILLNGLIIFGIFKGQHRTPLYYLIGNLAVIDTMTSVVSHIMIELKDVLTYQQFILHLVTVLHFPVILSLTGLVLLSVDRYISVQHAIFYHNTVNGGHVLAVVAAAWVFATLFCFSPMIGWNCKTMGTSDELCFLGAVESSYILFMTILCTVGVGVVVFTNVRVFVVLRRRLVAVEAAQEQQNMRMHIQRQQIAAAQKKARSVLLIIVVFLVAWLPFLSWQLTMVVGIHTAWDGLVGINLYFRTVFLIVTGLVPIVNPFVYAFRLPTLRRVVWNSFRNGGVRLWRCLFPPQQVHPAAIDMSVIAT